MVLTDTELKYYRRMLAPVLSIISSKAEGANRVSIGEVGSEITITCDNSVIFVVDSFSFICKEKSDKLSDCSSELCENLRIMCNKLSYIQTYKIRQIVINLDGAKWKGHIEAGEVNVSTEKPGEWVVILRV